VLTPSVKVIALNAVENTADPRNETAKTLGFRQSPRFANRESCCRYAHMSINTAISCSDNEGLFPVILRKPFSYSNTLLPEPANGGYIASLQKGRLLTKIRLLRARKPANLIRIQKLEIFDILGEKSATSIDFQVMHIAIPEEQGSASAVEEQR